MEFLYRIKTTFLKYCAKLLIHTIIITCRIKIAGAETIHKLKMEKCPIIYIFWHRHIFFTIYKFKKSGARPLISLSKDGEFVSQIAEIFGMNPIRGSSSRGGTRAFLTLLNTIRNDKSEILITADGPKGPRGQMKDGILLLAQKTEAAIIPISWYGTRVKILRKTWDKFILPLPFGKIKFAFGEPIYLDQKPTDRDWTEIKQRVTERLDGLEREIKQSLSSSS
jgi:lysophospholipid acyltransferase (LPLAT)-like uncharacterized protein